MWVHSVDCPPYHDYIIMILSMWADAIHFDLCTVWPGCFIYPQYFQNQCFFLPEYDLAGMLYIHRNICPDSIQFFLCKVWPGSYLYVYVCSNSQHAACHTRRTPNRSQSIQVSGTSSCPPVPGDRYNITIIPLLIMNYNLVGGLLTMQFEQVRRTC